MLPTGIVSVLMRYYIATPILLFGSISNNQPPAVANTSLVPKIVPAPKSAIVSSPGPVPAKATSASGVKPPVTSVPASTHPPLDVKTLFQKPLSNSPVQASGHKRPNTSSTSASTVTSSPVSASATDHQNLDVKKFFQGPSGGPSVRASEHPGRRRDTLLPPPSGHAWRRPKHTKGDEGSPSAVALKVCALLNGLTTENFDAIAGRVVAQVNRSDGARGDEMLRRVTRLVFDAGAADARWAELYARLCKMMTRQVSVKMRENLKGAGGGKHVRVVSGQLFHQRLVVLCQETCGERTGRAGTQGQGAQSSSSGSASASATDHVAWRARQRSVGSARFVGELFKSRIISERVMQECVQSLISVVEARPAEEEVERLCALLAAGGPSLRSTKALAYMADVFSKLKALQGRAGVGKRAGSMLLVRY